MYGTLSGDAGPEGEIEGHDDWAAQVPNAPACSLHKAGLSSYERLWACAVVRRVAHGSQIMEQRVKLRL
eukprot:6197288-Pleurochrysis_carterae.AAC.1